MFLKGNEKNIQFVFLSCVFFVFALFFLSYVPPLCVFTLLRVSSPSFLFPIRPPSFWFSSSSAASFTVFRVTELELQREEEREEALY